MEGVVFVFVLCLGDNNKGGATRQFSRNSFTNGQLKGSTTGGVSTIQPTAQLEHTLRLLEGRPSRFKSSPKP